MCKVFYYKKYAFCAQTGVLTFEYAVSDEQGALTSFSEQIIFPNAPFHLTVQQNQALDSIFFLAHIAFGISYYKAFCPEKTVVESGRLTDRQAAFFDRFYLQGLGEFSIRNHLNLQGKIHFEWNAETPVSVPVTLQKRCLVPVGGGKDSCVTLEVLKKINMPCAAVSIGLPRAIKECMAVAGLDSFSLLRRIDPKLIALNESGTVLNGHVPITGMLAFLLWAAALLYDYQYVALSCERSANSGNMMQGELLINHQYSKSFSFEKDFYEITRAITPDFRYFSLLRPLSELAIAGLFSQLCQAYFPVFTSCNRAFKLDEKKRLDRWCGCCDKCRFVFLILAPFMDKKTLVACVGHNPLDDRTQSEGYRELLGLAGHKPFECVGEISESRYALRLLADRVEWQSDALVADLAVEMDRLPLSEPEADPFAISQETLIPSEFEAVLQLFREAADVVA